MLCRELGIQKTRTTPYHPAGNGQVERMNRTLASMLAKVVQEEGRHWDECLPKVMMAHRASVQSSTRETPYTMVFGTLCRMPEDMLRTCDQNANTASAQVRQLKAALAKVHSNARRRLRKAALRQKHNHDRACAGSRHHVGDWVLLKSSKPQRGQCRKLQMRWLGPYCILSRLSSVTYPIQHVKRHTDVQVVHSDRLKPCPRDVRVPTKEKVRRPRSPVPTHESERPSTRNFAPYIDLDPDDPPMRIQSPTIYGESGRPHRNRRRPRWCQDYHVELPRMY
ncbi:hypothetical protein M513_12246 [Trichuris suis]|uniref:Integrase catalytic domain-containing protein n=1 Tax=Trichuris suis TaxID=68888 RepID=A0A085LPJ2_9BILA|nr:hypothetical protein M513_12246 [Trichuris suis]